MHRCQRRHAHKRAHGHTAREVKNHMTAPRAITRRLVAIADATAELGGVSRSTIYDLVNQGHLTKVNIGRRGFITAESLDGYVESLMPQRI